MDELHGFVVPSTTCPRCGDRGSGETLLRVATAAEAGLAALEVPARIPWKAWDAWRLRVAGEERIPDVISVGLQAWVRTRVQRAISARGLRGVVLTPPVVR